MENDKPNGLLLRPVHPDDAAQLYAIVSDPSVARTLVQLPSMEFSETLEWLRNRVHGRHRLVAVLDGEVVGSGALSHNRRPRLDHSGTLGLMVHPQHWGKGIGSMLMTALLDLADNWLNLRRVELDVHTDNPAAIHLYEKFGFQIEGQRRMVIIRDGHWQDEYLMARVRNWVQPTVPETTRPWNSRSDRPVSDDEITIRTIQRDDTAELHPLWRHPAVAKNTLQLPSLEYSEAEDKVDRRVDGLHRFVAVLSNQVVGSIVLTQLQNPRMAHVGRLGMMVHPDYWGRGIGSKLLKASLELADNWLNLKRIELDVFTDNPSAIHLYLNHGFEIEGTKRLHAYGGGRWADTNIMARIRGQEESPFSGRSLQTKNDLP